MALSVTPGVSSGSGVPGTVFIRPGGSGALGVMANSHSLTGSATSAGTVIKNGTSTAEPVN